ncbi:MAG: integration host factor [Firmicutes bacterium]|jgi:DNA uptake protein ComE-like DNA-binding protein|nr:integration host factor [Bacillota bacterium]
MALPKLSAAEKKEALEKAQVMRRKRSELRAALKKGKVDFGQILDGEDEVTARMRVAYLLKSLPRVGKVKAQKIMEEIGIDESRRVQGLGKRQKEALLAKLGGKG